MVAAACLEPRVLFAQARGTSLGMR